MWEDRSVVMHLFNALNKRKDQKAKQVSAEGSGTFDKLGSLRSLDADWVCASLTSTVGFSASQLVSAKTADDDALVNLLSDLPAGALLSPFDLMFSLREFVAIDHGMDRPGLALHSHRCIFSKASRR